jgi:hypothetical protein
MTLQKRPHSTFDGAPKSGFVVFDGGFSTIDCVVHYASNSGANLRFKNVEDVPLRFLLRVDDSSPSSQCVVIWRMGSLLGVEYEKYDTTGA